MIADSKFEKRSLLTKLNKLEACFHTANANAIKMLQDVTYLLQVLFMYWVGVCKVYWWRLPVSLSLAF
jgi:hypothetical protein